MEKYFGFTGDNFASALLANNVKLVGRSRNIQTQRNNI